jgi:hypothetical protein
MVLPRLGVIKIKLRAQTLVVFSTPGWETGRAHVQTPTERVTALGGGDQERALIQVNQPRAVEFSRRDEIGMKEAFKPYRMRRQRVTAGHKLCRLAIKEKV